MKVIELIEILEQKPPDAPVWIGDKTEVEDCELIYTELDNKAPRVVLWPTE
jgi:hypothetical protein